MLMELSGVEVRHAASSSLSRFTLSPAAFRWWVDVDVRS